jgi:hypothetical protein
MELTGLPRKRILTQGVNVSMEAKTEVVGIKNLKEVVELAAVGYDGVIKAKADGKIDISDIGYAMPIFQAIGPALADIGEVIPEAKDLSEPEIKELILAVQVKAPSLATEAETFVKVTAILNLLRAGKDCYLAFAK